MNILYVTLSFVGVVSAIAVGFMTIGGYAVFPPKLELPEAPNSIEELEPYLQNAVDEGQPPGISLIVTKGSDTLYSRSFGYADLPQNRAATEQTVYQWWSITKIFTAVAVLQLQEKGLLALDDPVSRYLEYFEVQGPKTTIK